MLIIKKYFFSKLCFKVVNSYLGSIIYTIFIQYLFTHIYRTFRKSSCDNWVFISHKNWGVRWGAGRNLNLQNKVKRTYTIDRNFHKFNKIDTWKMCRICSQLTTKTPKDVNDSFCPARINLLKVTNRNTGTRCEISSKLTIKTPERYQWHRSGVFIVNFEHISHLALG